MNALHGIHIKTVLFSHIFPNHHTHLSCDNLLIGHCVKLTVYLCDIQQPVRHGSCHILSVFGNQIRDGKEGVSGHILIETVEPVCSEYQIKGLSRRACQFHPVIKFTLRDDIQIKLQIELLFNLFVYILQNASWSGCLSPGMHHLMVTASPLSSPGSSDSPLSSASAFVSVSDCADKQYNEIP